MEASSVGWRGAATYMLRSYPVGWTCLSCRSVNPLVLGAARRAVLAGPDPDPARTARKNVSERRTDEDELRIVEGVSKGPAAAGSAIWRAAWPTLSRAVAVVCGGWDRIQASLSDSEGWMAPVSWVGRSGRRLRSTPVGSEA
jgi:hypothetical protein